MISFAFFGCNNPNGRNGMVTAVIWAMEGFTQLSYNPAVAAELFITVASRMQSGTALVLTDKNHDSDAFMEAIKTNGAVPVIPPKNNRKIPRDSDKNLYKELNLVIGHSKLTEYRRIANRSVRLPDNYMTLLHPGSIRIWLE